MKPMIDGGDKVIHEYGISGVQAGDTIVFHDSESDTTYVHRAVLKVEEGENWYANIDKSGVSPDKSCDEIRNCPAPRSGWITKGVANPHYDQAVDRTGIVQSDQIEGTVVYVVRD
jgi:signal peptidase